MRKPQRKFLLKNSLDEELLATILKCFQFPLFCWQFVGGLATARNEKEVE